MNISLHIRIFLLNRKKRVTMTFVYKVHVKNLKPRWYVCPIHAHSTNLQSLDLSLSAKMKRSLRNNRVTCTDRLVSLTARLDKLKHTVSCPYIKPFLSMIYIFQLILHLFLFNKMAHDDNNAHDYCAGKKNKKFVPS